jgi:hypothetical protein
MTTLETARKEREEHVKAIARLDRVIAFLTTEEQVQTVVRKRRRRQTSPEARTRQSEAMKAVWARRRKKANGSEAVEHVATN